MLDSVGDTITTPFYILKHGGYLRNMFKRMGRARGSGPIFLKEHLSFWQWWGGHYVTPITVGMFTYMGIAPVGMFTYGYDTPSQLRERC